MRPGSVFASAALVAGSVALTLAAAELGLRALAPEPAAPLSAAADTSLAGLPQLRGIPDLARAHQRGVFKGHLYRTDRFGLRGPDYAHPKPADVFRLAVAGDSFTMGSGVAESDTYSAVLARHLIGSGPIRYEVVNMGLAGSNSAASVDRLLRTAPVFEADLHVYGFTPNDIEGPAYRKTHLARARPRWRRHLFELARVFDEAVFAARDLFTRDPTTYVGELHANYFENPEAWSSFTRDLTRLANFGTARGVCSVVLLHTRLHHLHALHPFRAVYAAVAAAAVERGLHVAPSFESFRGGRARSLWVGPRDPHPNAEGHARLARALEHGLETLPQGCWKGREPDWARVAASRGD